MKETNFINQNKDKWIRFEKILGQNKKDPEELSNLFIEVTDDLSYSRSFYPNRSVRVYLNGLAQRVFYDIYKNRKSRLKKFWTFWKDDIPQVLFESRLDLLFSFSVFTLSIIIGIFSSVMDVEFPRVILGDSYVDMTIENIEKGKPMSVYDDPNQGDMFFRIAFNNLKVAFFSFILGLFFGIGTIFYMIYNGIMVGAFQYLFFQQGVYTDSLLTIWVHGAIEISAIIVAGASGIHLGRGLLFPGTLSRIQGLQLSARRALMIYLSLVPLIILAAFIESFITRYSDAPYFVRGLLIFFSFAFMIGYYVYYPWLKAKRGFVHQIREVNLPAIKKTELKFNRIKNSGLIFTDTFIFFRKGIKSFALYAAILAFIYTSVMMYSGGYEKFESNTSGILFFIKSFELTAINLMNLMVQESIGAQWFLNVAVMTVMGFLAMYRAAHFAQKSSKTIVYILKCFISVLLVSLIINGLLFSLGNLESFGIWLFVTLPILMIYLATIFNENKNFISAFKSSIFYIKDGFVILYSTFFSILIISFLLMFLTTAPLLSFFSQIIFTVLPFTDKLATEFYYAINIFVVSYTYILVLPLLFSSMSITHFSLKEIQDATDVFEKIQILGVQKKSYGMEREESY
jgi:uncharacterized membrane protein SpoIIM required for sporulation